MAHQADRHGESSKLGNGAKLNIGEKVEEKINEQNISHPSVTHHALHRTWPTNTKPSGHNEPQRQHVACTSAAMQRWTGETMREQPWNGVGSFSTSSSGGNEDLRESMSNEVFA
ncbi:hypothetical protein MMC22_011058 [Lobaria immixta]|nr:hypothetical protein [Lobaria immixta]